MTIRVALTHQTKYTFDHPVKVSPHSVRLRPAPHSRTPIVSYALNVQPRDHFINWQQDPFGNWVARLVFPQPVSELDITVDLVADMTVINPFDFFVEDYAETFPFQYPPQLAAELAPYLVPVDEGETGSGPGDVVEQWVAQNIQTPEGGTRIVDFLVDLNARINRAVDYTVRMEVGVQSPDETLTRALGSCRDSAWLLVSVLRQLGLAARFVSGYLVQLTADQKSLEGPSGPEADFTDLHAWAEVFIPGAGWIGLDATSGLFAGEGHIPLSATPHPASAAPITGATAPCQVEFFFRNEVTRIREDARVTKPYTREQWERIDALGEQIDARLRAGDVRLTMGGEPTFVSADDTSTPQWESAADGPEKRKLARELAKKLYERHAAGGLIHHGQGKWYPGEPLPRWQMTLNWRKDGVPLWRDAALLDDPWADPVVEPGSQAAADVVRQMAEGIAGRLGVGRHLVMPAYEDTLNEMWAAARLPVGEKVTVDPDPRAADLREDAMVAGARGLSQPQGAPRGYAFSLFRDEENDGWATSRWRFRRDHLFLIPGTSALGYRLPLDSLAWGEAPQEVEPSTFEQGAALAMPDGSTLNVLPVPVKDIAESPRTAVCVEERDGHVFVFLPPFSDLEHTVELLAAIESTADALGHPVVVEGYPLPWDARIEALSVTADPGVIEVNLQPTSTWADFRELTTSLYNDAREVRLATEKFDVDGTHTGTGGGNHFTLGGFTPAESPMLRRPDLLRSMITYWQHHPSLSYVFSGRFIGPTSQAPRVDEGRHETLYELEIAFAEMDRVARETDEQITQTVALDKSFDEPWPIRRERQRNSQLWLTDRLLRHLLTDLTGNTHRAEFCIDKLYSPDTSRGRLGLLEMRGFEMPPHAEMALVQALLVRSLVMRFWDQPYRAPLIRWGHRLHDRFLLPAFAAADLREVVQDLNRYLEQSWGQYSDEFGPKAPTFDDAWLEPFLEFRFPRLGEVDVAGIHLELRGAIEPWHVLGEEVSQSGTSRYVDSSLERVQVAANGLVDGRHVITCNGIPVPMVPTSGAGWGTGITGAEHTGGTYVGGVRYRAWAPPSALHPTIGIHSPLVFDVVDRWNGRSLAGFTYHVVHPGGRSYDDYPVNAASAQARRASRFEPQGHTIGQVDMSAWPTMDQLHGAAGIEYPTTLDLRRFSPGHRPSSGTGADAGELKEQESVQQDPA